jgi:starvation-inducible DNA-binding protein
VSQHAQKPAQTGQFGAVNELSSALKELLAEQADQIFAMTDEIAERARKVGGYALKSIGGISRRQRLKDNDYGSLQPRQMLSKLRDDNLRLTRFLRGAHKICGKFNGGASTSLIGTWIDQTERRTWFLTEIVSGT